MLRAGRGHIVNVASIVGFTGSREEAAYSATKAGLVGFSRSLRQELAGTGVCVSLIVPGVVDTPFFAARGKAYDRRWPHPLPADRVAAAIVAAILADRAEAFVPRWMRIAALLAGTAPRLYERLAVRFS
jgi:short-subunit dehydrogenase